MKETLYKRDARNNVIKWTIWSSDGEHISIAHGIYGRMPLVDVIRPMRKVDDEIKSRITAKRKEGYKSLEDLYDNSPSQVVSNNLPRREDGSIEQQHVLQYLQTYLPKYSTTAEGFVLPMLAKTLEDNKPFEKFGTMLGQWKINGLRCLIGAEKVDNDLFKKVRFTYTSREGTKWNLDWMDDIIGAHISNKLLELMVEEGVHLDGELYLPGYTVNDINSFVKNKDMPQHYKLQYWCYDIAIEGYSATGRGEIVRKGFDINTAYFANKDSHLVNRNQLVILPTCSVESITEAISTRDAMITLGFEGLILRNPTAEYAFGKRNNSMFKFKKKEDGIFTIVDIKEDKRGLPIYLLKNDINDECFECTINIPQDKQREQLAIKALLIGKSGLVEYRERSGVKQVPFHAKLIKVYV